MLLPVEWEAGAVDGRQRYRLSFSHSEIQTTCLPSSGAPRGRLLCLTRTWLTPGESCQHNWPFLPAITDQCHTHGHSNKTTVQLGPRQQTQAPTDTRSCLCLFSLVQPPHQLGSPQRKPAASLPSMRGSVPLAQGRDMPAACPQASIHAPFRESHFSTRFLLPPAPSPSPKHTKEGYKVGFFFSFRE